MSHPSEATPVEASTHTTAMQGDGFYNAHSRPQQSALASGIAPFARAASELPDALVRGGCVRIADMGCSQGRNSVAPLRAALEVLLQRGAACVEVQHSDLPSNDFNSLIKLMANTKDDSYVSPDDAHRVFVTCQGRSFQERLFPEASVALMWCSIATHWMQSAPHPDLTVRSTAWDSTTLNAANAKVEWRRYLDLRAKELVVGGQLVNVDITNRIEGYPMEPVSKQFNLAMEKVLGYDAIKRKVWPIALRTEEQLLEPFNDPALKLRVVEKLNLRTPNPFEDLDPHAYAVSVAEFWRAVVGCLQLERDFGKVKTDQVFAEFTQALEAGGGAANFPIAWHVLVLRCERVL